MLPHPLGIQPWGNCLLQHHRDIRHEGLGQLRVLSDELVLEVLALLPAESLSKLSCCCKALYCFTSHEDLWKAFLLEGGQFKWEGTWKQTFIARQQSSPQKPPRHKVRVNGFYSDLLYQPWFCATVGISEEWLEVDNIDRRPGLTAEEFRQHYDARNRPVLVPGGVAKWPAIRKWTHKYLRKAFKGKDVIVGNMPMSFQQYLNYLVDNKDEMPLYLFDKDFTTTAPHLAKDYWVPDCFSEDLFSVLGEDRPDYRWLIMGPARSGSSFHIDPNATSAWNACVTGSKKWILYPPSQIPPGVHPSEDGADVATPISITEWFLNYYQATKEGPSPIECIAKAGDVIFVPSGWWHLVLNLEESVAVTQNFVSSATLPKVVKFVRSKRSDLVSGCSMGDRATLHDRFISSLQEQLPQVWRQYEAAEAEREARYKQSNRLANLFKLAAEDAKPQHHNSSSGQPVEKSTLQQSHVVEVDAGEGGDGNLGQAMDAGKGGKRGGGEAFRFNFGSNGGEQNGDSAGGHVHGGFSFGFKL